MTDGLSGSWAQDAEISPVALPTTFVSDADSAKASVVSVASGVHEGLSLPNVVLFFYNILHLIYFDLIESTNIDVLPALEVPRKKLPAPLITVLVLTCVTVFSFGAWPSKTCRMSSALSTAPSGAL